GQPLALGGAALIALVAAEPFILPVYLVCTLAAIALAVFMPSGDFTNRVLRFMSAALLFITVGVHGYMWGTRTIDMMAWGVSGAMLLAVLMLIVRRRSPAGTQNPDMAGQRQA
ncbi:MAG: hypothetical protein AB7O43_04170, partial [Hyphomicrobiaceae bacterium]